MAVSYHRETSGSRHSSRTQLEILLRASEASVNVVTVGWVDSSSFRLLTFTLPSLITPPWLPHEEWLLPHSESTLSWCGCGWPPCTSPSWAGNSDQSRSTVASCQNDNSGVDVWQSQPFRITPHDFTGNPTKETCTFCWMYWPDMRSAWTHWWPFIRESNQRRGSPSQEEEKGLFLEAFLEKQH